MHLFFFSPLLFTSVRRASSVIPLRFAGVMPVLPHYTSGISILQFARALLSFFFPHPWPFTCREFVRLLSRRFAAYSSSIFFAPRVALLRKSSNVSSSFVF